MKFDDLYNLVLEAGFRPEASRNRGHFSRAQKNVGPMNVSGTNAGVDSDDQSWSPETSRGYSASSVGRSDNMEKRQKIDQMKKYLFDVSKGGDQGDVYEMEAENIYRMRNAFALLFNSKKFHTEFNNIFREHLKVESITYDDEKEWNRLKDEVQSRASKTTGLRDEVETYKKDYNDALSGKNKITEIKNYLKKLKNLKRTEKDPYKKDELQIKIENAEFDISDLENKIKNIDQIKRNLEKFEKGLIGELELEKDAIAAWEEMNDKIGTIGEKNKKSNDTVIMLCKKLINRTADGLLDRYQIEHDISDDDINSVNVDFAKVPKDIVSKLSLLKELKTDDNPIFAFIDGHEKEFAKHIESFDDRSLNKAINVGVMRSFNKLPAHELGKYFNTIAGRGVERKTIPLDNLDSNPKAQSIDKIIKKLETIDSKEKWNASQKELLKMAGELPFSEISNNIIKQRLKSFWEVTRRGTIAQTLIFQIQSMAKEQNRNIVESFDNLYASIIGNVSYDEDDYKLDIMEIVETKKRKRH
jgi:hypothetical protein